MYLRYSSMCNKYLQSNLWTIQSIFGYFSTAEIEVVSLKSLVGTSRDSL